MGFIDRVFGKKQNIIVKDAQPDPRSLEFSVEKDGVTENFSYIGGRNFLYTRGLDGILKGSTKSETYNKILQMLFSKYHLIKPKLNEQQKRDSVLYNYVFNDKYYGFLKFNNVIKEVLDDYHYYGAGYYLIETVSGQLLQISYIPNRNVKYYGDKDIFRVCFSANGHLDMNGEVDFKKSLNYSTGSSFYSFSSGIRAYYIGHIIFRLCDFGGGTYVEFQGIETLLANWIMLDKLAMEYNTKLLKNGGIVALLVQFDSTQDQILLAREGVEKHKESIRKQLSRNDGSPVVTYGKVTDLSKSRSDMDHENMLVRVNENIAPFMSFELPVVVQSSSTYDNFKTAYMASLQNGVKGSYEIFVNSLQNNLKNIFNINEDIIEFEIDKTNSLVSEQAMSYVESLHSVGIASKKEMRGVAGLNNENVEELDEKSVDILESASSTKKEKGPSVVNPNAGKIDTKEHKV